LTCEHIVSLELRPTTSEAVFVDEDCVNSKLDVTVCMAKVKRKGTKVVVV